MSINCQQALAWMSDYLDGDLDPTVSPQWEAHLRECPRCAVTLSSTRQMLRMLGNEELFAMPPVASVRLRQALDEGLGEPLVPAELRSARVVPVLPAKPRRARWIGTPRMAWAAILVVILLGAGMLRWRASAMTTSGWLIDQHCYPAFQKHPADHTRDCLLKCADVTYGLVDAKGHFHPFDAKGNQRALAAVKASNHLNHLWVTVRAARSDSSTLQVEQLELTPPTEAALAAANAR